MWSIWWGFKLSLNMRRMKSFRFFWLGSLVSLLSASHRRPVLREYMQKALCKQLEETLLRPAPFQVVLEKSSKACLRIPLQIGIGLVTSTRQKSKNLLLFLILLRSLNLKCFRQDTKNTRSEPCQTYSGRRESRSLFWKRISE